MSAVSPFRLFGRAPEAEPVLASDDGVTWAPGAWDGEPRPATRHARPVAFGNGLGTGTGVDHDPLTDPHGFPPIAPHPAARASGVRRVGPVPSRPAPDPLESAALAGAFAADYLSWDEDDPERRGRALADHLAAQVGDPALLGWDGHGRQRADFALPGLVRPDGDDRVLVDVRVRVTPYREVGGIDDRAADGTDTAEPEPDVLGTPAAAPAPTGRGWRGCASYWVRVSVPVVRENGRLVVDAAEETADLGNGDGDGDRGDDRPGRSRDRDRDLGRDAALGLDRDRDVDRGLDLNLDLGAAGYAEVRELREGVPAPTGRTPRPEPESAW